jgi:oligopeptide transport system substrate-binding protein
MYKKAEEILCQKDAVVIPLFFETYNTLVKSRIKGWSNMAIGGQHVFEWSF